MELPGAAAPLELIVELGAAARMRITCAAQIALAARLLQALNAQVPC